MSRWCSNQLSYAPAEADHIAIGCLDKSKRAARPRHDSGAGLILLGPRLQATTHHDHHSASEDFIQSIADALQYISYYHPKDYIQALGRAWEREQSPAAKDAMAQILVNSRMCAEGHRPICQDTGLVVVFVKVGMHERCESDRGLSDLENEGVRRANTHPDNILRAAMVSDPLGARANTGDNTPAVLHTELVPGVRVVVSLAAKGGGSENKARFSVLNPSASLVDWVLETVPTLGAGWCPPGILGIGVGGSAEKAMLLAKESLMEPIDIQELQARGPANRAEELRLELYDKVNALGIGAQGLGGLTTVLDVKLQDFPTHAASLPVALIPNCAATRHLEFELDGSGPARLEPPRLEDWPRSRLGPTTAGLDAQPGQPRSCKPRGNRRLATRAERLLLSGKLLCGRDAAHKRIVDLLARGETLPEGVDFETASSTTWAQWTRCETRWWAPPALPPPPAWTSSPR